MRRLLLVLSLPPVIALACGTPPDVVAPPPPGAPSAPPPLPSSAEVDAGTDDDASVARSDDAGAADAGATPDAGPDDAGGGGQKAAAGPCPEGMVHVAGSYCPRVERRCLRREMNKPNHLELCHEFAPETRCTAKEEARDFCIDTYEFPNREGGHPAWMVSWWDAEASCRQQGKRLCHASEWVMACEGPERTPFPYGWKRDQTACNIDNVFINPVLDRMYSPRPEIAGPELARLDQSVASGSLPRCVSGYGVHDMTGNFDEWVTRDDHPKSTDKGKWAGLKGGAWGHVRNACRPMTTSHAPEFTYYFVSFRCCADTPGQPPYRPEHGPEVPAVKAADRAREPTVTGAPGPSKHKVQPEN